MDETSAMAGRAGIVYRAPLLLIKVNTIMGRMAHAKRVRLKPAFLIRRKIKEKTKNYRESDWDDDDDW